MTTYMNISRTSKPLKEGLTLIEVIIATFLVTLLAGGVFNGIIASRRLTYVNAQRVEAFGLAKSKIEEMKGKRFTELNAAYGVKQQETDLVFVNLGGDKQKVITANRTTTLEDLGEAGNDSNPVRKRITVEVEWEYRGRNRSEELVTYLYPKR